MLMKLIKLIGLWGFAAALVSPPAASVWLIKLMGL